MAGQDAALGKAFAEALARKDFAEVAALLEWCRSIRTPLPIAIVSPIASTSATRMEGLWLSNRRTTPSEKGRSHGCACSAPDFGRADRLKNDLRLDRRPLRNRRLGARSE